MSAIKISQISSSIKSNDLIANKNNEKLLKRSTRPFLWSDKFIRTFSKVWLLLHASSIFFSTLVQSVSTIQPMKETFPMMANKIHNYTSRHNFYYTLNKSYVIDNRKKFSNDQGGDPYKLSNDANNVNDFTKASPNHESFNYNHFKYYSRRFTLKKHKENENKDNRRVHGGLKNKKKFVKDLRNTKTLQNVDFFSENNSYIKNLQKFYSMNNAIRNENSNNSLEKVLEKELIRRQAENSKKVYSSSLSAPALFSLPSSSSSQAVINNLPRRRRYYISKSNIDKNNNINKNINGNINGIKREISQMNKNFGNKQKNGLADQNHQSDLSKTYSYHHDNDNEEVNYYIEPQKLISKSENPSSSIVSSYSITNNQYVCSYSGHVVTNKDWYGFLANLSIAGGTGRMEFEFKFPTEMCCMNVLFYTEDQLGMMNSSMNCWQKENLATKSPDKFLSLTPNFSWSGCNLEQNNFHCKGGRSFVAQRYRHAFYDTHPDRHRNAVNWYVAISNCDAMRGIDITFRFIIYGHSIPCSQSHGNDIFVNNPLPPPFVEKQPVAPSLPSVDEPPKAPEQPYHGNLPVCNIEGYVNTTNSWFGFLKNISLKDGGGFKYVFSLPFSMTPMSVYLYHSEDIRKLRWEQICWIKHGAIESSHAEERIITLSTSSVFSGCATKKGANIEGNNLTCKGERIFRGDRDIYIAVGNCRGGNGVILKYRLEVFGYKENTLCSISSHATLSAISILISLLVFFKVSF